MNKVSLNLRNHNIKLHADQISFLQDEIFRLCAVLLNLKCLANKLNATKWDQKQKFKQAHTFNFFLLFVWLVIYDTISTTLTSYNIIMETKICNIISIQLCSECDSMDCTATLTMMIIWPLSWHICLINVCTATLTMKIIWPLSWHIRLINVCTATLTMKIIWPLSWHIRLINVCTATLTMKIIWPLSWHICLINVCTATLTMKIIWPLSWHIRLINVCTTTLTMKIIWPLSWHIRLINVCTTTLTMKIIWPLSWHIRLINVCTTTLTMKIIWPLSWHIRLVMDNTFLKYHLDPSKTVKMYHNWPEQKFS